MTTKEHFEKIIAEAKAGIAAIEEREDKYWHTTNDGYVYWARRSNNIEMFNKRLAMGCVYLSQESGEKAVKWKRIHIALMQASDGWDAKNGSYRMSTGGVSKGWERIPNIPYFNTIEKCFETFVRVTGDDRDFYLNYDGRLEL